MLVHFIGSKSHTVEYIDSLRQIVAIIKESGHELEHDWIDKSFDRISKGEDRALDWSIVYKECIELINKSDVVIAETTYNSFGVGFQLAIAVQQKKPILLLRHESADKDAFATGIIDSYVEHEVYNDKTLKGIVKGFLERNDIQTKDMRFNFFIDRHIYNYLRWSAHKTGKTKAEILRDLVAKEIERETPSV